MSEQLVVTSIGTNRRGMVNEITSLAAANELNILYSRMAIMGNEFTYVMLVEGSSMRINRFESAFINLCARLDLMSVVKRTSNHRKQEIEQRCGKLTYTALDKPGLLSKFTQYFAQQGVSLANLRCEGIPIDAGKGQALTEIAFNKPESWDPDAFVAGLQQLLDEMQVQGTIEI
ncbi:glycine cleavage system protein R [Algibacillus agarilyticus]|uniref:glycine cleavage system protein R n=1 Tax=Algibacillus agarilyticus TaxID=2234133 RepID=UPI000DD046AD|nr:ACT domain-containing protein [Algibacillus agarilyticus]